MDCGFSRWDGWHQLQAGLMLAAGQCRTIPGIVQEGSHLHSWCCNELWCPLAFMGTAHFLLTSGLFQWPLEYLRRTGYCGQAANISGLEPWIPFQKIILALVDYCNSIQQVSFSALGQTKQVFRGILPTRNDVGDLLWKTDNHSLISYSCWDLFSFIYFLLRE